MGAPCARPCGWHLALVRRTRVIGLPTWRPITILTPNLALDRVPVWTHEDDSYWGFNLWPVSAYGRNDLELVPLSPIGQTSNCSEENQISAQSERRWPSDKLPLLRSSSFWRPGLFVHQGYWAAWDETHLIDKGGLSHHFPLTWPPLSEQLWSGGRGFTPYGNHTAASNHNPENLVTPYNMICQPRRCNGPVVKLMSLDLHLVKKNSKFCDSSFGLPWIKLSQITFAIMILASVFVTIQDSWGTLEKHKYGRAYIYKAGYAGQKYHDEIAKKYSWLQSNKYCVLKKHKCVHR